MGGVTVRAGDRLLPIFFVSLGQVNVQIPLDLAAGSQTMTVGTAAQGELKAQFQAARNAPGLFQQAAAGKAYAVATHADGSPVTLDCLPPPENW